MKKILNPQSIAIVGASNTTGKIGNILAQNIIDYDFTGKSYFINTKDDKILGKKSYTSLSKAAANAGGEIDVAIIAIPAQFVEKVIREGSDVCKNYVIISAGFGESDSAGHNREIALAQIAKEKGLTIVGPNCLGFISPKKNLNASFAPGMPMTGSTAFISQSGALAVALIDQSSECGIGFSNVISIGNKMDVDGAKLIDYFATDPETHVIALYLESIGDGPAFLKAAKKARDAGKTIILLKSGRSTQAQNAIALHTGSLAGDDAVISAACKHAGVLRVNSIKELFSAIVVADNQQVRNATNTKSTKKRGVTILTNAGGPGVITTDAIAMSENLTLNKLTTDKTANLKEQLPAAASTHNPIDLLGDAQTSHYKSGIDFCLNQKNIDVIVIILTPQKNTPATEIAKLIATTQKKTNKIILTSFIGGKGVREARKILHDAGISHCDTPTQAIEALDALLSLHTPETTETRNDGTRDSVRMQKTQSVIKQVSLPATYYAQAKEIAELYNIPASPFSDVTTGLNAKTTYPCVLKVDHPLIAHKSDRGGVILPIQSGAALEEARIKLLEKFPEDGVRIIAQPLTEIQTELIIGMKRDVTFGPVMLVGMGGIYTEIFDTAQIFVDPPSASSIEDHLKNGPLDFLFTGTRGQKPYNAADISNIVYSLLALSRDNEQIEAIDINPLLIYNKDNHTARAVDIKMTFSS